MITQYLDLDKINIKTLFNYDKKYYKINRE